MVYLLNKKVIIGKLFVSIFRWFFEHLWWKRIYKAYKG